MTVEYLYTFFEHEFDYLLGYIFAHTIVHATPCQNNFGIVAVALSALGQVVGIDSDAMASYETRAEGQEVLQPGMQKQLP